LHFKKNDQMKKILLLSILLYLSQGLFAQNSNYGMYVHSGMIVKNWLSPTFPKRNPSFLTEFRWAKQSNGAKAWHKDFNYPETAISIFTGYLGNNQQFGTTLGIVPNISFNTLNTKKWHAHFTLGIGLSYFNRPFDSISNPYNILIGSHITNMSFARLWFGRSINQNLDFRFGATTIHASNGHYQIPNVGMNIPNFSFAFIYKPKQYNNTDSKIDSIYNRKWHFNLRFGYGVHEFAETTEPVGTPKYNIYILSPYFTKRLGRINNFGMGINIKYYTDFYKYLTENNLFNDNSHLKASVVSFFLSDELLMNRFSFLMQGALDLYNPFYIKYDDFKNRPKDWRRFVETWTSTRMGLQYYLFDTMQNTKSNIYFGLFVNANFGEADFVELSSGIVF